MRCAISFALPGCRSDVHLDDVADLQGRGRRLLLQRAEVLEELRCRGQGRGHGVQERLPASSRNPGVEGEGIPDGVTDGLQRSAFCSADR